MCIIGCLWIRDMEVKPGAQKMHRWSLENPKMIWKLQRYCLDKKEIKKNKVKVNNEKECKEHEKRKRGRAW